MTLDEATKALVGVPGDSLFSKLQTPQREAAFFLIKAFFGGTITEGEMKIRMTGEIPKKEAE